MCNVTQIITYGRPGTPMQAWGVAGGGPKNDQSIQDLVAYLRTIQLTPAEAQKQAAAAVVSAVGHPRRHLPNVHVVPGLQLSAQDVEGRHRDTRHVESRVAKGARATGSYRTPSSRPRVTRSTSR